MDASCQAEGDKSTRPFCFWKTDKLYTHCLYFHLHMLTILSATNITRYLTNILALSISHTKLTINQYNATGLSLTGLTTSSSSAVLCSAVHFHSEVQRLWAVETQVDIFAVLLSGALWLWQRAVTLLSFDSSATARSPPFSPFFLKLACFWLTINSHPPLSSC